MDNSFELESHDKMNIPQEQFSPNFTQCFNSPLQLYRQQQSPLLQLNNNNDNSSFRRIRNDNLQAGFQAYIGGYTQNFNELRINQEYYEDSVYKFQKSISQFDNFGEDDLNNDNLFCDKKLSIVSPFMKKNLCYQKQPEKQINESKVTNNLSYNSKLHEISTNIKYMCNNNHINSNINENNKQSEMIVRGRGRPKKNTESQSAKKPIIMKKTISKMKNSNFFSKHVQNEEKQQPIKQDILKSNDKKQINTLTNSEDNSMKAEDESLDLSIKKSSNGKEKKYQISTRQSNKIQKFNYQELSNDNDKFDNQDQEEEFMGFNKTDNQKPKKNNQSPSLKSHILLLKQSQNDSSQQQNTSQNLRDVKKYQQQQQQQQFFKKEQFSVVDFKEHYNQGCIKQTEKSQTNNFNINNQNNNSIKLCDPQQKLVRYIKTREQLKSERNMQIHNQKLENTEIRSTNSTDFTLQYINEIRNKQQSKISKQTNNFTQLSKNLKQEYDRIETPVRQKQQSSQKMNQNSMFDTNQQEQCKYNENKQKIELKNEENGLSQQQTVKQIEFKNEKNKTQEIKINESSIKNLKKEFIQYTQSETSLTKKSQKSNSSKKIKKSQPLINHFKSSPKSVKIESPNLFKHIKRNYSQNLKSPQDQFQLRNLRNQVINKKFSEKLRDLTKEQSQLKFLMFLNDLDNLSNIYQSIGLRVKNLIKQIRNTLTCNQTILSNQQKQAQDEQDRQIDILYHSFLNHTNDQISNPIYNMQPQQKMNSQFPKFQQL